LPLEVPNDRRRALPSFRSLAILGTGAALPARILRSEEIDASLGRPAGWLEHRVGIQQRHVCDSEDQIDLAVAAARQALHDAAIDPAAVGLVIFAAAVPYQSIPSTAPLIQRRLGIADGQCAAFDINSTCLSFVTALDVAAGLAAGRTGVTLIVASEVASRALPWDDDPITAALFGDGAAAAVVSTAGGLAEPAGIVASRMETYPEFYDECSLAAGGTRFDFHREPEAFARHARFAMDGKALFRHTLQHFEPFLDRLLDEAGWSRDEVDLVVPHQASPLALAHLAQRCGFGESRVVSILRDHGNQVAASIPSALHAARRDGRLEAGMRVLMLGTSAGLSLGGLALVA